MNTSRTFLLSALCLLGCEYPTVTLGTRAQRDGAIEDAQREDDNDNDNDERVQRCDDKTQCTDVDLPFCDEDRGRCVECLRNGDCTPPEICESDGECDRPE